MEQAILKLDNIIKDYRVADSSVHALKGVSLNFRKKEFVSILGASGCGKTTLLNIIGGLDQYTSGDLIIKGVSTKHFKDSDWDAYRNHSIGFVFQSYNLIPHQTVLGNVELALTLSGVSVQERKNRAEQALRRVGLGDHLYKKPNQLSGGQMQRVAIARALVNNPEILLADEPTGALDTETSIQIMDLIKEIAGERLVIMVTHNPELARKYSTRIVELKDGLIISDSNPFEPETESGAEPQVQETDAVSDASESENAAQQDSEKKNKKKKSKTSMSFWTAFLLSGRNLLTKKARTIVTSVAGSIGIISVCLVLALSSGFNNYMIKTQEDMLSYYPLEITETTLDPMAIMSGLANSNDTPPLDELENKVFVNSFLTQIAQGMTVENDLGQDGYYDYLYGMDESWYYAIQKSTGATIVNNLCTTVTTGIGETEQVQNMSVSALKAYFIDVLENQDAQYAQLAYLVDYLGSVVSKMPGTSDFDVNRGAYSDYVLSQYDVLAGSFPKSHDEAVLVIRENNDLTDLLLAQLGYISQDDFLKLFNLGNTEENPDPSADTGESAYMTIGFDELMAKPFTLYFNDAIYDNNITKGEYSYDSNSYPFTYNGVRDNLNATENEGVQIKITGVLRLKKGLTYGCLSDGLNVTEQLVERYIEQNMQSQIVKWMTTECSIFNMNNDSGIYKIGDKVIYRSPAQNLNGSYYAQLGNSVSGSGLPEWVSEVYVTSSIGWDRAVRSLGGNDEPNAFYIFPRSFDTKDKIIAHLDAWNDSAEGEGGRTAVQYTDKVGLMMGMVQTMLDAITYVLVAFTSISLVVSTVMIGVITYVSVVERTKEIGILRAIGARKRDIKSVFNAETFIIGLCSGVFGVAVAYLLQFIINLILTPLTGIAGLAALRWSSALIMIAISVVLTLISGLVPASAAAKRDPVVALRSE